MSKVFGRILEVKDLQTVSDINELDIKLYEAEPMLPRGWTRIFTYQNTVGYMDELQRVQILSAQPDCRYLFRADGPELYYAKLRVCRSVCKACRNKAYKGQKAGQWTDKKDCLLGAWWPDVVNPIRPEYGDIATYACPGPILDAWMNDYMVPKVYAILATEEVRKMFSEGESAMIMRGFKYHLTKTTKKKVEAAGHSVSTKVWKEAFNKYLDASIYNRIGIRVDSPDNNGREPIQPPPIWCPYKEEHDKC